MFLGIYIQQRPRSACTSTKSDQGFAVCKQNNQIWQTVSMESKCSDATLHMCRMMWLHILRMLKIPFLLDTPPYIKPIYNSHLSTTASFIKSTELMLYSGYITYIFLLTSCLSGERSCLVLRNLVPVPGRLYELPPISVTNKHFYWNKNNEMSRNLVWTIKYYQIRQVSQYYFPQYPRE